MQALEKSENFESAPITPRIEFVDATRMEELVALEQRCYPSPWSPDLVRGEFAKDISYRLALFVEGEVVAYTFAYLIPEDLHLLNIAVAPEWRGMGYGKYLLCSLLERACVRGVRVVSLEVRPSNETAKALYRSLGFRSCGLRKNYYRDNGEDALLLERNISPADLSYFSRVAKSSLMRNG